MSNVSDPIRKTALKQAIVEVSNSWLQAESHREHAKEVIAHTAEEYEMDKAMITQLARIYHKQNGSNYKAKSENIIDMYELIFGDIE